MNDAAEEFGAYIAGHLEKRRADPRDDIISRLLLARFDGERLSDEEIVANVMMFFMGGHETTVNLIGNGMLALLRHPGQLRALREDRASSTTASRSCSGTTRPSSWWPASPPPTSNSRAPRSRPAPR